MYFQKLFIKFQSCQTSQHENSLFAIWKKAPQVPNSLTPIIVFFYDNSHRVSLNQMINVCL